MASADQARHVDSTMTRIGEESFQFGKEIGPAKMAAGKQAEIPWCLPAVGNAYFDETGIMACA